MKRLIVTGDDFGLAEPVNEAIELAHRDGILTTASLMVGAAAARDAVERARRLPSLRVGLHVVLVDGRPVLPAHQVAGLVDTKGEFLTDLIAAGLRFFFRPDVRRQIEAEIGAQFEAFKATGLELDHVNAHNHMHLHPTILGLILKAGAKFGLDAMRVPYEPPIASWRAGRGGLPRRLMGAVGLAPWTGLLRRRLRRALVKSNDRVFGLNDTGNIDEAVLLRFLQQLPDGVTEIYFHPSTRRCPEIDDAMPDYRHQQELAALISPAVLRSIERFGIQRITFSDL